MPLKPNEFARRDNGAVETLPGAMRLRWALSDLWTKDNHTLEVRFACSAQIADTATDRKMFVEHFLNQADSVSGSDLIEHFQPVLRNAATSLAAKSAASDFVDRNQDRTWIEALSNAIKPLAFAAGLELLPPFQFDASSPTLQRQQAQQLSRARVQESNAAQLEQMEQATELLKRFQALRAAAPEVSASQLLGQFAPAERGRTLQTLLLASTREEHTAPLFAVSGPYLLRIDPQTAPPTTQLIELPTVVGPLRSVQPTVIDGQESLLIGARNGVILANASNLSAGCEGLKVYLHPAIQSQLGFNAAVCDGRYLWATHGEAGLIGWDLNQPADPIHAEAPTSAGPRNLMLLANGTLIYSAGNSLIVRDGNEVVPQAAHDASEIIQLVALDGTIVCVHQTGTLVVVNSQDRKVKSIQRRGTSMTAAAALPWLGETRLLLATEPGPIDCIGLDDPLTTEYLSAHKALKIVTASKTHIAAISPDRQRLILWTPWDGQRPLGEIHLTARTKHRIADLSFS